MAIELSNGLRVVWNWGRLLSNDLGPRVINVNTEETVCELIGHTDMIRGGFELSDGSLVTWSNDQTVRIWDIRTGACKAVLRGHQEYIEGTVELPDGLLVSFGNDQKIIVWNLDTAEPKTTIEVNTWVADLMVLDAEQRSAKGDNSYVRPDVSSMIKPESYIAVVWERYTGSISCWDLKTGSLIGQVSHRFFNTTGYCLEQLFDLPGTYFASHCWSDRTLHVWCARTGNRRAGFNGRWDGLAGYYDAADKLKIFGYYHQSRHIEFSSLDVSSPDSSNKITIPGARVSLARIYQEGLSVWTEDFRLIVLDRDLQVLKMVPIPIQQKGDVKVVDPYSCHMSEKELARYLERADENGVKYYSPGESGPGFMQAQFLASPSSYKVCYFSSEEKKSDELIAEFSAWPGQKKHNLFKYTSDSNKHLIFKDREGSYKAIDFLSNCNEAPFTLSDLPETVGDAEFWDHVYCGPRSVLLSGGYVPDQTLSRLLPVIESTHTNGDIDAYWNLLNDRKMRVRITTKGDIVSWNVDDKNSLSLIVRDQLNLSEPLPLVTSDHPTDEQGSLLIAPDGALHLWYGGKPVVLNSPMDGQPVCVNAETRRYYTTHYWDDNGRVCIIGNRQLTLFDAETGETLHTLPTPFDGGVYGVALVNGERWIAWSRAELASWSAENFRPLYHLKDPGEWGPGYENVVPLKNGGIAYCSGCWSSDNRVVVWDGASDLRVVHCHDREVVAITELADGSVISFSEADLGFYVRWKI